MSDAADRRIAELEQRVKELGWENDNLRKSREVLGKQSAELHDRDLRHIESLRKQLVERDVYEAQQILPPEQAALIKHLATVERCIEEGPREAHYADDSECQFCGCREGGGHEKTCAWLALQFDRKPAETMALVEGWAWEENDRRDRTRAWAMTPREQGPALTMMGLNEMLKAAWPAPVQEVYADNPLLNSIRGHVQANPLVPPGTAYLTNLSAFERGAEIHRGIQARLESEIALRLKMDEINGTGLYPKPDLGIPDTAVAPPDDEDVP